MTATGLIGRFPFTTLAVAVETLYLVGTLAGAQGFGRALIVPGYAVHFALSVALLPGITYWPAVLVFIGAALATDLLVGWFVSGRAGPAS